VGVTLIGVGFGLMLLIGVGGSSLSEGIGVGGFLVVMGVAYVINSFFEERGNAHPPADYRPAAPSSQPGRDPGGSSPV